METALMALPSLAGAVTGVSAPGEWATTVQRASGLSSLGSGGSWLQGGATAVSALASIAGGKAAAGMHGWAAANARTEAEMTARGEELNAEQEYIAGANAAVGLREQLNRTIGGQRVAFAASGVDAFSGTPATLERIATERTEGDLEMLRSQTEINALQRQIKASQARQRGIYTGFREDAAGAASSSSGWMQAIATGFKGAADIARRGN